MLACVSQKPVDNILISILGIFPNSILTKGYFRTPSGVSTSFQMGINPRFRKCAAQTYLEIMRLQIHESPATSIYALEILIDHLI